MRRSFKVAPIVAALSFFCGAALADCPPGFETKNGQCEIKRACPVGQTMRDGKCQSASACPAGQQYMDGLCVTRPAGAGLPNPVFKTK